MKLRFSLTAALLAAALSNSAAAAGWSYTGNDGPEHWGELSPAFASCQSGKNQSPVDLADGSATALNRTAFRYTPTDYTVENNGHTIQATPAEAGQQLKIGDKTFAFKQFHFHTPSEHTFKGKNFPMEVHFVHQSESGELAVLGVMFAEGKENPALKPLLAKKLAAGEKTELGAKLDIMPLLPRGQKHYRLNGSLTTPPCSEGVNWVVFKQPVSASKAQLDAMREMIGHDNNRPVQPLNARVVVEE